LLCPVRQPNLVAIEPQANATPVATEASIWREVFRCRPVELTWRPIVTRSMTIKDEGGHPFEVDCHVTFSLSGPFAVEVWQAIPGTPLATPQAGWLHHLGYWVEDYPAEAQRLNTLGFVPFLTSEPTLLLSRGPGNICVEPCDLHRDQP
jgi:hypothetical protein